MKQIIGVLAYFTAASVIILGLFFDNVAWPVTTVAVVMLVLGALWAWTDTPTAPCRCPQCGDAKRATADDVR